MPRTTHTPATLPELRRFKQACQESGLAYGSMRDAHFRGELAVIRIGRAWYVEVAEFARFVERHRERLAG
jgi:hypothetical protein